MDEGSLKELKKHDMAPYFTMGRLRFRLKEGGQEKEAKKANKDEKSKHPGPLGNKGQEMPKAQTGSTAEDPSNMEAEYVALSK